MYFAFYKYFGPHLDVLTRLKNKLITKKNIHVQVFRVLNVRFYSYCLAKLEYTSRSFLIFLQMPFNFKKFLK